MVISNAKLGCIATTKDEYVVASEACKEAIWLGRLVANLGIKEEMLVLHCEIVRVLYNWQRI